MKCSVKKLIPKIVASTVVFAIVIAGLVSVDMNQSFTAAVDTFETETDLTALTKDIEEASKKVSYFDELVDLYSVFYRILGVRQVKKNNETIIRMNNDMLRLDETITDAQLIEDAVQACARLNAFTQQNEAELLYCFAPRKSYFPQANYPEYTQMCDGFIQSLRDNGVNVLDFAAEMESSGMTLEDSYFYTDHHWKIETGFWASGKILERLNSDYGYEYDEKVTDISNFNIRVYEDWFLGSIGKKVGRYFTPYGVDDISIITPKFETKLHVQDDSRNRNAEFDTAFIRSSIIDTRDYHSQNPYTVYGWDYPEQKVINEKAPENSGKLLVIRDSYACSVTPFLSLGFSEMRAVELRKVMAGENRIESVEKYITDYKPDYVIILYSGVNISKYDSSKYDFS